MSNKFIEEDIEEAREKMSELETRGEVSVDDAERLLRKCVRFVHPPHLQEFEKFLKQIDTDYELKVNEAKQINNAEKDSYLKFFNIAQFILTLKIERVDRMFNFISKLNKKM